MKLELDHGLFELFLPDSHPGDRCGSVNRTESYPGSDFRNSGFRGRGRVHPHLGSTPTRLPSQGAGESDRRSGDALDGTPYSVPSMANQPISYLRRRPIANTVIASRTPALALVVPYARDTIVIDEAFAVGLAIIAPDRRSNTHEAIHSPHHQSETVRRGFVRQVAPIGSGSSVRDIRSTSFITSFGRIRFPRGINHPPIAQPDPKRLCVAP